ncbi:ABC transporter substrate-binding protein, partial [Lactobacillus sp.]|uniref:ABC transporter substrate-binding protein n=1 Tax=Lactobacillus sp. TaxID=1591 RepID=UPI003EF865F6
MKKSQKIILAFLAVILLVAASGLAAKKYVDQKAAKEERIVVTSNALAEIFAKLNIDLVGVPKTKAALPKRYQKLPTVGSPMAPSLEKIAVLNPSQVYAVSTLKSQYSAAFKKQAIPVTFLKLDSVDQLETSVKSLGNKYQRQNEANNF